MRREICICFLFGLSACAQQQVPEFANGPTAASPALTSTTSIPPIPTFTVSGVVSDGSSAYGSGPCCGLSVGSVRAVDEAHAGIAANVFTGGAYTIRNVKAGVVTFSASSDGYRTIEKTVSLDGDTRVDFALPRASMSAVPSLGGTWAAYVSIGNGSATLAEFKLVQTGAAISGTWSMPAFIFQGPNYAGTVSGTINGERSFIGSMTLTTPCASSTDIRYGVLDYPEQVLTLGVLFPMGSCLYNDVTFKLDRRCHITSTNGLSCS